MKITGKATRVSREFIRSWVNASAAILAYHNYPLNLETLKVQVKDLSKRTNKVTGGGVGGTAHRATNTIELSNTSRKEQMASIIVHECIHIALPSFDDHTEEKIVSTLTSKLKSHIAPLALLLEEGTYVRAGILAHKSLSYPQPNPEVADYYDDAQWVKVGAKDKYKKKNKKCA